ncbi:MAG: LysR family transcriptional regulator [Alphaproteobacteria bacterium]|nr:LysR family transcriptional regulator [Alphaproteobacteria bacterium]
MNLRFIESFVWLARLHSVTRTAEKLHLTQSAVSSRIAALEDALGTALVDRRDRGFRLTHAGERFLQFAEQFLELEQRMQQEFENPAQAPLLVRIGGIETVLHTWLIPLVERLQALHPSIEFDLTVEMTPVLNEQARRGALDLVFTAAPMGGGLDCMALPAMDMCWVGPRQVKRRRLTLKDIANVGLMTFQRGSQPHVALVEALALAGLTDKRVHAISSISALVKMVESGFGYATFPRAAAEQLALRHEVAIWPSDLRLSPLPLYAINWPYPESSPMRHIIAQAVEVATQMAVGHQKNR